MGDLKRKWGILSKVTFRVSALSAFGRPRSSICQSANITHSYPCHPRAKKKKRRRRVGCRDQEGWRGQATRQKHGEEEGRCSKKNPFMCVRGEGKVPEECTVVLCGTHRDGWWRGEKEGGGFCF